MSVGANVTSINALVEFRAAWVALQEKITQAISTTEGEITAAFRFLEQQQQHWKIEVTKRHEAYIETRQILNRKELGRTHVQNARAKAVGRNHGKAPGAFERYLPRRAPRIIQGVHHVRRIVP